MATIPMGEFDLPSAVPRAQPSRVDLSGSMAAGRAMERAGQRLEGDASRLLAQHQNQVAQQQAKAQAEAEALTQAKAANASADYELRVAAEKQDFLTRLGSGLVEPEQAQTTWDATVAKIPAPPPIAGMAPDMIERYQGVNQRVGMRARLDIGLEVEKSRRAGVQREVETWLDNNEKLAALPGHTVEQAVARNNAAMGFLRDAGFDEAKAAEIIATRNERLYTNEAGARLIAADAAGNMDALRTVLDDLTGEQGRYLTTMEPDRRNALTASVVGKIEQLQRRQEVGVGKVQARAASAIEAMSKQAVSGYPPKPGDLLAWQQAAKAAGQQDAYNAALAGIQEVQTVLRLAPVQQEAYVNKLRMQMQTQGASTEDQARFKTLSAAIEQTQKTMRDAPLLFMQGVTGEPVAPIDFAAIDFAAMMQTGDMSVFGEAIVDRMATLMTGRQHYGAQLKLRPLMPEEAKLFVAAMDNLPPNKLTGMFGTIRAAVGSDAAYQAVMQQIAPDAPLKAYAGQLAVKPGGQLVAGLILRGEALLNTESGAPKWKMPPDKDLRAEFVDTVGTAYMGRELDFQRDFDAVRAVYAASAAKDGNAEAGLALDETLLENSIRAVIGEPAVIEGVRVLPPWGMSPDNFEDRAEVLIEQTMRRAGYDEFSGVSLMATDEAGVYTLNQGRKPLDDTTRTTAAGQPAALAIDINADLPKSETRKPGPVEELQRLQMYK